MLVKFRAIDYRQERGIPLRISRLDYGVKTEVVETMGRRTTRRSIHVQIHAAYIHTYTKALAIQIVIERARNSIVGPLTVHNQLLLHTCTTCMCEGKEVIFHSLISYNVAPQIRLPRRR